ncbi:MAG TPA: Calx-beta domain-containing protein, partial [Thermoanaerobaculia bacterium]|nr:Calx-beta domain-containing protein [Thermoanaerobaculia bacterium]
MRTRAALLLLAAALSTRTSFAQACAGKPDAGQFYIAHALCDINAPCLPGRRMDFRIEKRTTCYPWYAPCPGYSIQSCDIVKWDFSDGTSVTTNGDPAMSHTFQRAGQAGVTVTVTNPNGTTTYTDGWLIAADPLGYLAPEQAKYTVNETAGSITIKLKRTGDVSRSASVDYRTGYNPGRFERNLEVVEGTLHFAPGETTKSVTIAVADDHVYNGDQWHTLFLESFGGDVLLPRTVRGEAEIRIVDDDPAPTATTPRTVTVLEGDSGTTTLSIPVTLSQSFLSPVTLWWMLTGESAQRDKDWGPPLGIVSGGIVIPAGATQDEFKVDIVGDTTFEDDERFRLEFIWDGGPPLVPVGSPVTITIVNDDIAFATESMLVPAGQRKSLAVFGAAANVALASSDPAVVDVPASASVAPDSKKATFDVVAGRAGSANLRATVPGTAQEAKLRVTVYDPVVPSFARRTLDVQTRSSATATLRIDPPPAQPTRVALTTASPWLIDI